MGNRTVENFSDNRIYGLFKILGTLYFLIKASGNKMGIWLDLKQNVELDKPLDRFHSSYYGLMTRRYINPQVT